MKYLSVKTATDYGFKDDDINKILSEDIKITDLVYKKFFELHSQGKQFRIKNQSGTTFEEMFEEYTPPKIPQPPTEIQTLQSAVDFILMNY